MDYTTLKNRVFENYYFNSYLPGTIGAFESSNIFNYLLSLESIQENQTIEMNVSERWIDSVPTWYTDELPKLFFIPKFNGETDQGYIDRLLLLVNISQDDNTMIIATWSVIQKALNDIGQITISEKLDGASVVWSDSGTPDEWNTGGVWGDATQVTRPLFLVNVTFPNRGSQLDITTWDYWHQSENYTKIQDMVNLYKPPGSTFELRLEGSLGTAMISIFSNTLIEEAP